MLEGGAPFFSLFCGRVSFFQCVMEKESADGNVLAISFPHPSETNRLLNTRKQVVVFGLVDSFFFFFPFALFTPLRVPFLLLGKGRR